MNLAIVILSGIGAAQGLLFAVLILLKKQKQRSDWLLFFWFLVFVLHLSAKFGFEFRTILLLDILIMTLGFLHGPFFWVYAKTILGRKYRPLDWVHFLPFWIFFVGSFWVGDIHGLVWELSILVPKIMVLTLYPLLVLGLMAKEKKSQQKNRLKRAAPHYLWLRTVAYIFLISVGISMVRFSIELSVGVSYFVFWDILRYVLLVTVLGFFGLKYGMVYRAEEFHPIPKKGKYKDSPLRDLEIDDIYRTIDEFFLESKAYLNPKFSLMELSKATQVKKHHLSQVINVKTNTGFYDLVNSKRIAYATERLKLEDGNELTLEGLGYECGFNSKSVFFQNFKKYTGQTPGKFRREIGSD